MKLIEIFGDPTYLVKRRDSDTFEVAKFTDRKEPEVVYVVHQHALNDFSTNSPGFHRMGQAEKHIKLVKHWLKDGEPTLTYYTIKPDGTIVNAPIGSLREHSSANPFVSLVSSIDLKMSQIMTSLGEPNLTAARSLAQQLNNLLSLITSVSSWIIPEPKLKSALTAALPVVKKQVEQAIVAINALNFRGALERLQVGRNELVIRSRLSFSPSPYADSKRK